MSAKILVVDDSPTALRLTRDALAQKGFEAVGRTGNVRRISFPQTTLILPVEWVAPTVAVIAIDTVA